MAKLEFIKNTNPYYIVEPGRKYRGLGNPFKMAGVFEVLDIIPDCNYQIVGLLGDKDSTNRTACEKCIKAKMNYRVKYNYLGDGGNPYTRARHRFKLNENFKLA